MNKRRKKILGLMVFCFFGLNCLFLNPVSADEDTQFLLSDIDNVATGLNNFTDGYLTFDSENDNIFVTSTSYDLTSPNSVRIYANNGADRTGIVNLTNDFSYIGFINISFEQMWSTDSGNGFYWNFTDYNGNDVIRMRFTDDDLVWWQVGGAGWTSIDGATPVARQYLHIHHNGTNQFHVEQLTSAFVVDNEYDLSGAYAGAYTNFSQMNFHIWSAVGDVVYCYFDNFYISTDTSGSFCDLTSYDSICSVPVDSYGAITGTLSTASMYIEYEWEYEYTGTIYSVILPISNDQYNLVSSTSSDYELAVNGFNAGLCDFIINFGDYYGLQWCDINNGNGVVLNDVKPLFAFYSKEYYAPNSNNYYHWYGVGMNSEGGVGDSRYHRFYQQYLNDQLDGSNMYGGDFSVCFYHTPDLSDDIIDSDILSPYITKFGNEFIQFYDYNIKCRYKNGDYPRVIYNLSDDNMTTDNDPYVMIVYKIDYSFNDTGEELWYYQRYIMVTGDYKSELLTLQKQFSNGEYIIKLYNSTSGGSTLDTLLYVSLPITICVDDETDDPTPEDKEEESFNIMIGVMITMGLGIGFLIITKEPIAFVGVSGAMAFILSRPELHDYRLFPEIVGIGIVLILILIGFIAWISN